MPSLKTIKSNPAKVDQIRGCCGFAGTIMALLVRRSDVIDELARCISQGAKFKDITKSPRVKNRLLKRSRVGIIADTRADDFVMCLALMILFKEYCKQNTLDAWDECIEYSRVWSTWSYAAMGWTTSESSVLRFLSGGDFTVTTRHTTTKLENVPNGTKIGKGLSLTPHSYKAGDFAVSAEHMTTLLDMVGIEVKRQTTLVNTTNFRLLSGKKASFAKLQCSGFHDEIRRIQLAGSASSVDYSDIILGVGNKPGVAGFEAYHNVTHWVYVPVKPNARPRSGEFKCWTWGDERDFWAYMTDARGYYPAHAIYLA